jgi:DNA-binding NarL/FixJ family response regulator
MFLQSLLVDDNDAFLEAAGVLLEREGMTVVGVASDTAGALRQARALRPTSSSSISGWGTRAASTLPGS